MESVSDWTSLSLSTITPFDVTQYLSNSSSEGGASVLEHLLNDSITSTVVSVKKSTQLDCSEGINFYRYVTIVLLGLPVSVFGIVGNVLAFIVLCHQKKGANTNLILKGLAIADILYLLLCIPLNSVRYIYKCSDDWLLYKPTAMYIHLVLYPVNFVVRIVCTWLTALLTTNRWVAVCRPLHAQQIVTRKNIAIQIFCIVTAAVLITVPKMLEFVLHLRRNVYYRYVYDCGITLLMLYIIPMVVLVVFNVKLTRTLCHSEKDRSSLQHSSGGSPRRSVTILVLVVTFTFIVCNSFSVVSHVLYSIYVCFPFPKILMPRAIVTPIANLMLVINSAINFLIYCVCSKNFRKTFVDVFCCKSGGGMGQDKKPGSRFTPMTYLSLTRTRSNSSSADKFKHNEHKEHMLS